MKTKVALISEKVKRQGKNWLSKYQCFCGKEFLASKYNIESGKTRSCGCIKRQLTIEKNKTHGLSRENGRLYAIWKAMRARCNNPNSSGYKNYGGRGIKISEEWSEYPAFYRWATENGYEDGLSIDRIDVNGNYESGNCRWADQQTQATNTRISIGWEKVNEIRRRLMNGESPYRLAEEYEVYYSTIKRLRDNKKYKVDGLSIPKHKRQYESLKVIQIDVEGREIAEFESTKDASEKLGIAKLGIQQVCTGRLKTTAGMRFKYKE